jgi:hypothetical protein
MLLLMSAIVFGVLSGSGLLSGLLAFGFWLPIGLAAFGWAWWIYEGYRRDLYILTNQDISDVDKKPFGPENRRRAPLSSIQDITFNVTFIENLLGYGDVVIQTGGAGGGTFTFSHVPNPRGVQATLNDYLTDFRKREKERQLRDTVALLREYHTAQLAHGEGLSLDQILQHVEELITARAPFDGLRQQVANDVTIRLAGTVRRQSRSTVYRFLRKWLRAQQT